jgi:hypothetical protein
MIEYVKQVLAAIRSLTRDAQPMHRSMPVGALQATV